MGEPKRKNKGAMGMLLALLTAIGIAVVTALLPKTASPPKAPAEPVIAQSAAPEASERATRVSGEREPVKLVERCSVGDQVIDVLVEMNLARTENGKKETERTALRVECIRNDCDLQALGLAGLDTMGLLTGYEMRSWRGKITRREQGVIGIRFAEAGGHAVVIDAVKQQLFYRHRTDRVDEEGSSRCGNK